MIESNEGAIVKQLTKSRRTPRILESYVEKKVAYSYAAKFLSPHQSRKRGSSVTKWNHEPRSRIDFEAPMRPKGD
jgi:hypothetical protein